MHGNRPPARVFAPPKVRRVRGRAPKSDRGLPFMGGMIKAMHRVRVAAVIGGPIGLLACASLAVEERFEAHVPPVDHRTVVVVDESPPTLANPQDVALYAAAAPPGFGFEEGELRVRLGYGHRVLGRVELWLDEGLCDHRETSVLAPSALRAKLRELAHRRGATAVVFVEQVPSVTAGSDCARVEAMGPDAQRKPWMSGWAVRLEAPQWAQDRLDAEAREAAMEVPPPLDAGVPMVDAGEAASAP